MQPGDDNSHMRSIAITVSAWQFAENERMPGHLANSPRQCPLTTLGVGIFDPSHLGMSPGDSRPWSPSEVAQ